MRQPFCILNVVGDVLDDGELCFVEAAQTLDAAKARVRSLAELWSGEYVIYDAAGVIDYQYVIVPTGFKEDKWVQMLEVRPTDRAVVHHIIAYLREPGSNFFKDQKPGVFFIAPPPKADEKTDTSALPSDFLVGYAPLLFRTDMSTLVFGDSVQAILKWG